MPQQKKIPLRRCTGCNEAKPKKDLVRVVRTPEGEVLLDPTGKKNGRGAYICKNIDCFQRARRAKRFERAFECTVSEEVYDAIAKELES